MQPIYLTSIGLHAETCANAAGLGALLAREDTPGRTASAAAGFSAPRPHLTPKAAAALKREDRPFLTEISISVRNAVHDALGSLDDATREPGYFHNTPLYVGTDSAEHSFAAVERITRETAAGTPFERLGKIRNTTNPLEMLRLISTNPTYHASKVLGSHGGGYPVRTMSLSGLSALEDAVAWLAMPTENEPHTAPGADIAAVIAAGNMRNFEGLVAFGKLGLLARNTKDGRGVHLSWGAAAALLSCHAPETNPALAEILDVRSYFVPETHSGRPSWEAMLRDVAEVHGAPNTIVCYANGAVKMDQAETKALDTVFPDVPRRRYKRFFGYTGKANTLLDFAAALADSTIPINTTLLIEGSGFGFGVGYVLARKTAQLH